MMYNIITTDVIFEYIGDNDSRIVVARSKRVLSSWCGKNLGLFMQF